MVIQFSIFILFKLGSNVSFSASYVLPDKAEDLTLTNLHSVHLNKILYRPFNMPYAFSLTTLAPKNFFMKIFLLLISSDFIV